MKYINNKHERYAKYLEMAGIHFMYREVFVDYTDTFTGKRKRYFIDFVLLKDTPEWVEVIQAFKPTDKRIVAERRAEEAQIIYRPLTKEEAEMVYG